MLLAWDADSGGEMDENQICPYGLSESIVHHLAVRHRAFPHGAQCQYENTTTGIPLGTVGKEKNHLASACRQSADYGAMHQL